MRSTLAALTLLSISSTAVAQGYVYAQPMATNGGTLRNSQLWIDPTGQNDSDNDAIAWEDFELPQTTTITRLRWWGDAAPPLGFEIAFFDQDPNTIAVQPDIFTGPFDERIYASFSQSPAGGSLWRFDLTLAVPLTFQANTRYFVSVVGREPLSYVAWRWAASSSGPNGTFWWSRGMHMYFHLPESRALALAAAPGWEVGTPYCFGDTGSICPCGNAGGTGRGCANSTGAGASLTAYGDAVVGADTVVLTARQCPPATLGLFFGGADASAPTAFGDGLRCVSGNVIRLGIVPTSAGGVAASASAISTLEGLTAGQLRRYQFWYRNVLGPCGYAFNTTNGLAIQW